MLCVLIVSSHLRAQNNVLTVWEENIEQLSLDDEEHNWEDELEELHHTLQSPININTATKQQLERFPFLTDSQIENLLAYIYINGQMQTISELQMVYDMDKRTIDMLRQFVYVEVIEHKKPMPSLKTMLKHGKHELLGRLDVPFYSRKGYEKNYLGTPQYHSTKYSFRYSNYLQAGITAEKDAGEPLFALHNSKGYDYYSAYFLLRTTGWLKTLALGNYKLSFGQGLVLNTNFSMGKTFSLSFTGNRATGIRKHSSTDEYNYLRGVAAAVEIIPALQLSAFYSHRSLDGVVKNNEITSIHKTGLHRTQNEVDKISNFNLQLMGGNLNYQKKNLTLGATGIYYFFNRNYNPSLSTYAKYNIHGNRFYNASLDYKYRFNRFTLTGEAAIANQGYALLNQLKYTFSSAYQLLLVHRYYAHNYWAMFARSFGEGSTTQNENGWYIAAQIAPFSKWNLFASLDMFSFPWWKYRISKPSQGVDAMLQAIYTPQRNMSILLNYRYKRKERDVTGTSGKVILPTYHHRFRCRFTYTPSIFTLRTTVDYNRFNSRGQSVSRGYQITQLCSSTFNCGLKLSAQATYFHTDDYDSRVYASERGLLYTFYTPSFYGEGFRLSTTARYDINKNIMLLVKLGQTIYSDRNTIGSGNDLISSNKKADLQAQLRLKF